MYRCCGSVPDCPRSTCCTPSPCCSPPSCAPPPCPPCIVCRPSCPPRCPPRPTKTAFRGELRWIQRERRLDASSIFVKIKNLIKNFHGHERKPKYFDDYSARVTTRLNYPQL